MAGTSVFGTSKNAVVVKAGRAKVTTDNGVLMALGVQLQYGRQVEIVPTLGDRRMISVGEGQGTISINTVLCKDVDAINAFGLGDSGCKDFTMSLTFKDGTCGMSGRTVRASHCIASAVSIDAQGGRGYIANGVQISFTALEI